MFFSTVIRWSNDVLIDWCCLYNGVTALCFFLGFLLFVVALVVAGWSMLLLPLTGAGPMLLPSFIPDCRPFTADVVVAMFAPYVTNAETVAANARVVAGRS